MKHQKTVQNRSDQQKDKEYKKLPELLTANKPWSLQPKSACRQSQNRQYGCHSIPFLPYLIVLFSIVPVSRINILILYVTLSCGKYSSRH